MKIMKSLLALLFLVNLSGMSVSYAGDSKENAEKLETITIINHDKLIHIKLWNSRIISTQEISKIW